MEIGEIIRAFLKRRETTQRWLAHMMNVDEKTLSGKLSRNSITADELLQIGDILDIDLNKLKKGEILMLKYFYSASHGVPEEISERIYKDGEDGYCELYKVVDEDNFIYKLENEKAISERLGIEVSKYSTGIEDYLDSCDGGQWVKVGVTEISLADCIYEMKKDVDSYESQIYDAKDPTDEIWKILKGYIPKIIDEKQEEIDEIKRRVADGTFEW